MKLKTVAGWGLGLLALGIAAPSVAVVAPADARGPDDTSAWRGSALGRSPKRCIPQHSVNAVSLVEVHLLAQHSSQMVLVEDDDVVLPGLPCSSSSE